MTSWFMRCRSSLYRSWICLIAGCSVWSRCIDFTPLNVSGRITIRTVKVMRMIATPQLPSRLSFSSIRSCQNSRIHWQASISGCRTFAMYMGLALGAGARAEQLLVLDEIHAAMAPGVAAQDPPGGQDGTAQHTVAPERLDGVLGAARMVLAARRSPRRDGPLVEAHRRRRYRAQGTHGAGSSPAASPAALSTSRSSASIASSAP